MNQSFLLRYKNTGLPVMKKLHAVTLLSIYMPFDIIFSMIFFLSIMVSFAVYEYEDTGNAILTCHFCLKQTVFTKSLENRLRFLLFLLKKLINSF